LAEKNGWDVSFGANGMRQSSQNKGKEFLIPEYNLFDIGGFTIVKKSFGKLDLSGGIRYDTRTEKTKDLYLNEEGKKTESPDTNSFHQFTAFNGNFSGISGSVGATYQFSEKAFAKINAARGYRSPNIGEIGSNGVHEGTKRYELGNSKLKAENSFQLDLSFGLNTEHITLEIDAFDNMIDNYIFSRKLNSTSGGDSLSDGVTTFQFVAGNANLSGGEIMIDIHPHPLDWLHFENSFSFVQANLKNQSDSMKYLPFIPAPKLESEFRADIKKTGKFVSNTFIKAEVENYLKQDKFYSAFGTETETPAYTLINAGIGTTFLAGSRTLCTLIVNVNNIADVAYQSHLSRLKYGETNNPTGRTGVYNMGRNISFKLIVPLNFKK
jgi:iron complex outermembrane recepter protein